MNEGFELGRENTHSSIEMIFTPNGFAALIGSLMAVGEVKLREVGVSNG